MERECLAGNIQPDLYKKKETVFFQSREARSSSCGSPSGSGGSVASKFGRLHFRLKYDFDKSDLVVHVIEGEVLRILNANNRSSPFFYLVQDRKVYVACLRDILHKC